MPFPTASQTPLEAIEAKPQVETNNEVPSDVVEMLGNIANQEEHEESIRQALVGHPWTMLWITYAIWVLLISSYDNGAGSTVIGIPRFRQDYGSPFAGDYVLPAKWQSAYSGGPSAASILGSLGAGYISDKVGRKTFYFICFAVVFIGITLETVSNRSNAMFFGGKFVCGFAIGGLLTNSMAYIGEISPMILRGILTAAAAIALCIGPFVVSLIQNAYGTLNSPWAYRSIFVSQYGITAIAAVILPFMPESPTWLIHQQKEDQAARALRRLGQDDEQVQKTVANIRLTQELAAQEINKATYLDCFRKTNLRRTVIASAPLCMQAFCGIVFVGYVTYYTQLAGYSTKMSYRLNVCGQVLSMVGNFTSWFIIERFGRRPLTIYGLIVLMILLMVTGGLAVAATPGTIKGAIALLLLYGYLYNATIGATAYTALTEIATSQLRAKTASIAIIFQSALMTMWAFVLPYIFNPNEANLGAKTTFIFGGSSVFCVIFLWFYFPETKGRSYQELDEMFIRHIPARDFAKYVTDVERKGSSRISVEQQNCQV